MYHRTGLVRPTSSHNRFTPSLGAQQISPEEAQRADRLLQTIDNSRLEGDQFKINKQAGKNTLIGIKKEGQQPVILLIHDKGRQSLGKGGIGTVFKSSWLAHNHNHWFIPDDPEHQRVMKIQDNRDVARDEFMVLESQKGTLGSGVSEDNKRYIDMLKLDGMDFHQYLEKHPPKSLLESLNLSLNLIDQTMVLSAAGKAHPDLKPQNIMINPESKELTFIDFSFLSDTEAPELNENKKGLYTLAYAAPELAQGKEAASEKTMVFALGIMLLNLLSDTPNAFFVAWADYANEKRGNITLTPDNFLPGLKRTNPELRQKIYSTLIGMVAKDKDFRPSLNECYATLSAYSEIFKKEAEHEAQLDKKTFEIKELSERITQLTSKADQTSDQKEYLNSLKKRLSTLNSSHQYLSEELKTANQEKEKLSYEKNLLTQRVSTSDQTTSKLTSENNSLTKKIEEIKDQSQKSHSKLLGEKNSVALKHQETEKQNKQLQQQISQQEKTLKLYEQEKEIQLKKQQQTERKLYKTAQEKVVWKKQFEKENEKALTKLKNMATNKPGINVDAFSASLKVLSSIFEPKQQFDMLNQLFLHIILNKPNEAGHKPYNHQSLIHLKSGRPYDFTTKQQQHVSALKNYAKDLIEHIFSETDDTGQDDWSANRKEACRWLDNSPLTSFPETLKTSEASADLSQTVLSSIPEAWRYRDYKKAKLPCTLTRHFTDGRQGKATETAIHLTADIEKLHDKSPEEKGAALIELIKQATGAQSIQKQMATLESLFDYIAFDEKAYTRADQSYFTSILTSVLHTATGESLPRQDIVQPSSTKTDHLVMVQKAYEILVDTLSTAPLNAEDIKTLCKSRLVRYFPAQYQHKIGTPVLRTKVHDIMEKPENVEQLMQYYKNSISIEQQAGLTELSASSNMK